MNGGKGSVIDPHEYRLQLVDAGAPHPDKRLLMLLRTLREFGFILVDAEGAQPPEAGTMETLSREHGLPFGRREPEPVEDPWKPLVEGYLAWLWGMSASEIAAVIRRCEADLVTRGEYLRLAEARP